VWLFAFVSVTPYVLAQNQKWGTPNPPVISWTATSNFVGQYVTVEGTIVYTYYTASGGGTNFLDFHYPYEGYFYGVIFSSDSGKFKCSITQFYLNKEVHMNYLLKITWQLPSGELSNNYPQGITQGELQAPPE
jgi:hypothetical protein